MPVHCSVFGCTANSKKCPGLSFHSFPKDKDLLEAWLVKLRHGKVPSKHARVCSRHFVESDFNTPLGEFGCSKNRYLKPNVVPSENLPTSSHPSRPSTSSSDHSHRLSQRNRNVEEDISDANLSQNIVNIKDEVHLILRSDSCTEDNDTSSPEVRLSTAKTDQIVSLSSSVPHCIHNTLKSRHQLFSVCVLSEKQFIYFTDFTRTQFDYVWQFVVSREGFEPCHQTTVDSKDQLLLTLMKLRTNMSYQTLAYSFDIDEHFVSGIFNRWIDAMYSALKEVDFRSSYMKRKGEYDIVISCIEIPIQISDESDIAQTTYSTSKSDHTFKALVGCSESGVAVYCSDLFGGSLSESEMVQMSGFLDHVKEGQFILADERFLIGDLLKSKEVTLNVPPVRESHHVQMTSSRVAPTKVIPNRQNVIEQIIGKAKTNAIISDKMPSYLWPLANKIVYVLFFSCNFKKKTV